MHQRLVLHSFSSGLLEHVPIVPLTELEKWAYSLLFLLTLGQTSSAHY